MRRYESYKDSGVEWLGEVPSHWELGRISTYFTERRTKVSDKDYPALSVTKLGVFPQWENVAKTNDGDNRKLARKGDFVINSRSDRKGSSGIAKQDGSVSLINIVLQPKKINSVYSEYLFKSYSFIEEFYRVGHGIVADLWTTRFEDIKNSLIIFPPLSEQQKIAQFLDEKTAKIDQAVDLAEKQIALLKEHKQILIQNAVTRGLNPDVPLKDSGVEWIGQVPKHWEVKKLKYLAKFSPSKSEITCNHEESCSFIPMEKLKLNTLVLDEIKQIKNVYSAYTYFRDEDLLIAKVTPCFENKNFAIAKNLVNSIGFGSSEIYVLRAYNNLLNKFLFYRLQEQNFMEIAISKMSGTGGLKRVPSEFINNFQLALPPFCEQQKIADYLDKQTAKIDQAIALKTAYIEKLKEYKSVLINDVVTGKVRVSV